MIPSKSQVLYERNMRIVELEEAHRVDMESLLAKSELIAAAEARIKAFQEAVLRYGARVKTLEELLTSIRGYMSPGDVMPVPEQAKHIVQWISAALAPKGSEQKGACPKCGCEETNSRGLWTCECPEQPKG